jgi:hypothetical protein
MPTRRALPAWPFALAALPAAWLGRQALSPALGAILLLALFAVCATRPGVRRRGRLAAAFLACFVAVHLIALVTGIAPALAACSIALGALTWAMADHERGRS